MLFKANTEHATAGFTFIEVIISITVSAVLGVMLVQFMSSHTERSYLPILSLNRNLALQGAMDQVTSDYRKLLLTDAQPLVTLQNNITTNTTSNGGNYWTDTQIQIANNYCIDFVQGIPGTWSENLTANTCTHPSDTLLKLTLSLDNQTLTSIFAR